MHMRLGNTRWLLPDVSTKGKEQSTQPVYCAANRPDQTCFSSSHTAHHDLFSPSLPQGPSPTPLSAQHKQGDLPAGLCDCRHSASVQLCQHLVPCRHMVLKAKCNAHTAGKHKAQAKHGWLLAGCRVSKANNSPESSDLKGLGSGACWLSYLSTLARVNLIHPFSSTVWPPIHDNLRLLLIMQTGHIDPQTQSQLNQKH